jgi:hypothetical protein
MKTCNIFLTVLSLSIWLAGCSEADDGKVILKELVVNPASLELAANDSKTIAASPVPPNSSDLVFSWTTNKEGVVTLSSADGPTVWVSGVAKGEVIVTVTCNGMSIDIPVTVFPAALRNFSLNETKVTLYINNPETKKIDLVATPDPLDAPDAAFEWSAEPAGFVSFSNSTGATTTVTAEKLGETVISARSGEITKKVTVNIVREASLSYLRESIAAQWKFDDASDLGKATRGENLQITGVVKAVQAATPWGANGAVEGTKDRADLRAHHGLTGESLDNFTILWDAQYPSIELGTGNNAYYAAYWNGVYVNDASMSMVYRTIGNDNIYDPLMGTTSAANTARWLCAGAGTYYALEGPYVYPSPSSWMRIVMTVSKIDNSNVRMDMWKNGVKVMDNLVKGKEQLVFTEGGWIYLLTDGGNLTEDFYSGDGDDNPHPLANVALWGFAMSNAEVRLLGTMETEL